MTTPQGTALVISAFVIGVVLVIIAIAVVIGIPVREITKDAALTALGALVGALTLYVSKK
jgi:hypothetical protein